MDFWIKPSLFRQGLQRLQSYVTAADFTLNFSFLLGKTLKNLSMFSWIHAMYLSM